MNRPLLKTLLFIFALPVVSVNSVCSAAARGNTTAKPGSAGWCHEAVAMIVPASDVVKGRLNGQPFVGETVLWNSFSITFKQNHKRYGKIVINLMNTQKPLCNIDFDSDSNKRVQVYVFTRSSNSEKVQQKHYTASDKFGLKFALFEQGKNDTVPGLINLRLPDGSFISGRFTANKAPRVIWDDEAVLP